MTELAFLTFAILASTVCLLDWRTGIYICIFVGFTQDALRKITPGEPVYMLTLVVFFIIVTLFGALLSNVNLNFRPIHRWNKSLRMPLYFFVALVLLQANLAYVRTGSIIILGIGLLAYLLPLPTLLLSYRFAINENTVYKVLQFYIFLSTIMLSGIFLSVLGYDWAILKSVGSGLTVYSSSGAHELYSGFLRSPEVAAWHGGTSVCVIIILLTSKRFSDQMRWLMFFLVLYFLAAIILTGRRKMLVEIFMFVSIYGVMLIHFNRGAGKLAILILLIGVGGGMLADNYITGTEGTPLQPYYERSLTVGGDATDRLYQMTVSSLSWVFAKNGFWGAGAGTGSQGAQHFGGGSSIVGFAAEGGLGKVLAELGVPGLLVFIWLGITLVRYFWGIAKDIKFEKREFSGLIYGLSAFLAANGVVFVTAHQVFGDIFVLLMLGLMMGFILAAPQIKKNNSTHFSRDESRAEAGP